MNKLLVFLLASFFTTALMAYSDSDLDGVADKVDKCPNTPLTDLVDINGCTIKTLSQKNRFKGDLDVIVGLNYVGSNYTSTLSTANYSTSLQVDYYYKNFSFQASTSYFITDSDSGYNDHGLNDSFVGAAYSFTPRKNLTLRVGLGALLPTYDSSLNNNNTDYVASLNASYMFKKFNIFAGYIYTKVNDDDVSVVLLDGVRYNYIYEDTSAYSLGVGYYPKPKLYVSGAYNIVESVYQGVDDAKTLSLYAYYGIDKHWFLNASYAYGLNDEASDNALSLKLGYAF
jgi:hypothetical protein